jgi:hypothetical protein
MNSSRVRIIGLACLVAAGLAASVALGSAATGPAATDTTTTAATMTGAAPPANTAQPSITGTTREGQVLSANPGEWTNAPSSYEYQWLRCDAAGNNCQPIVGATARQYTLTSGDVGHHMRVAVTAHNAGGAATATSASSSVVEPAASGPANSSPPTISGTPQQDSVLTVNPGAWSGSQPIAYTYSWQRCDTGGGSCATVVNRSTSTTYTLTAADVGHTMRAQVTATNTRGSSTATTQQTALVGPAKSAQGSVARTVADVALPDRLVIDRVQFSPDPLRSRTELVGRFHVADTRGFSIQGALVYALGLPYGWTYNAPEQPTDARGWATIVIHPTAKLPLRRGGALVMFIRARKPGDDLLAGVSTRRLVQANVGR